MLVREKSEPETNKISPEAIKSGEKQMINEIIAIYAITDDLLKALGHDEDIRTTMSDAEVITERIGSS